MLSRTDLARELHGIGAVRFGDFQLKDGRRSPVYVDLRVLVAHPAVLKAIAAAMVERVRGVEFDCLAGIPYAGLPLAVAMALECDRPLVYPRKEAKAYGTRRQVEGVFRPGDVALVIDDVITTGGAKLEAIVPLRDAGLLVRDVLVVVDREQSGAACLHEAGLRLHSLIGIHEVLDRLEEVGAAARQDVRRAREFLRAD